MNLNCKIFYDDYLYKLNTYSHKNIILRKPQVKKFSWLPFLGFFIEFLYIRHFKMPNFFQAEGPRDEVLRYIFFFLIFLL